jgi:hypothetical protein
VLGSTVEKISHYRSRAGEARERAERMSGDSCRLMFDIAESFERMADSLERDLVKHHPLADVPKH